MRDAGPRHQSSAGPAHGGSHAPLAVASLAHHPSRRWFDHLIHVADRGEPIGPQPDAIASHVYMLAEVGRGRPAIAAMLVLVLALAPRSSSGVGLRWISGSSDLTFNSALRCTLVVAAESGEQRLPPTWRLTWVAQGCSIEPVALDPLAACLGDLAQVTVVLPPATPADSAAHTTTALLCSAPTSTASGAFFLLDLPAARAASSRRPHSTRPDSLRMWSSRPR